MRSRFRWLSLAEVKHWEPLASDRGVSMVARGEQSSKMTKEGFVQAYSACKGKPDCMERRMATPGQSWAWRREGFIKRHLRQARKHKEPWWNPDGTPTNRHLGLIMWAYSPVAAQLKKKRAKRNPDETERELERMASQGDVEAEAKLIKKRIRATTLFEEQVRLLADLGDQAAILAVGPTVVRGDPIWAPPFAPTRILGAGPMYAALLCLATIEDVLESIQIEGVLEASQSIPGRWHRLLARLRDWLVRVRNNVLRWLESSPEQREEDSVWPGVRPAGIESWQSLSWQGGTASHGLNWQLEAAARCGKLVCQAMWSIQNFPQGGGHRFHNWPGWLSEAIHHASRIRAYRMGLSFGNAPRDPGTWISAIYPQTLDPLKARALALVKPWVWARGPMTWRVPQRNPQPDITVKRALRIAGAEPYYRDMMVSKLYPRPRRFVPMCPRDTDPWIWVGPDDGDPDVQLRGEADEYRGCNELDELDDQERCYESYVIDHYTWSPDINHGRLVYGETHLERYPPKKKNPPERWEEWQHSIPEADWVRIWSVAEGDRRAALTELRQFYWAWIHQQRGSHPRLFGEQLPEDPLPPWEDRPYKRKPKSHEWELGD